jgi:hypothetical protein
MPLSSEPSRKSKVGKTMSISEILTTDPPAVSQERDGGGVRRKLRKIFRAILFVNH